jgi:hypothetical protein
MLAQREVYRIISASTQPILSDFRTAESAFFDMQMPSV